MNIIIIDYGMGNLRSVQKKLSNHRISSEISSDPELISKADKLILPGVGHFYAGVKRLKEFGIWDVLHNKVLVDKTPILGICLGMQLMCKHSEEGDVEGLGWFDADVVRFKVKDTIKYKIPHMGWNQVVTSKKSVLFNNINTNEMFYFVHAYHVECNNKNDVLGTTEYSYLFTSVIQKENIYGTQFHPEKSHKAGEKLLLNFINL